MRWMTTIVLGVIFLGFASFGICSDDLSETTEIQFTGDAEIIQEKAFELGSPTDIYEYVKNNFEYALYHGSRSGSLNTFLSKRGNDVDQASTLIAMLRSQGVPSRYAVGTVRVASDRLMNWLGVRDLDLAVGIMRDQGIQNVVLIENNTAVEFEHVWVDTLVSYHNYRGAGSDTGVDCSSDPDKCHWVSLDPSFKLNTYHNQDIDIHDAINFDYTSYYNAIKNDNSELKDKNPLEIYEEQILGYLRTNHPGKTLEDVADPGTIIREENLILPASLPYELGDGDILRYASVEEHDAVGFKKWTKYVVLKVKFGENITIGNAGTVSLAELSTKRLTLTYEVGYLERLVTRLDGEEIAVPLTVGSLIINDEVVGLGYPFTITVDMDGPPAVEPEGEDMVISVSYQNCVVGGYYLIATGGETSNWSQVHRAADQLLSANQEYPIVNRPVDGEPHVDTNDNGIWDESDTPLLEDYDALDALTGGLLYSAQALYYARIREQIERLEHLNHVVTPISGFVGVISSVYEVEYIDGTPFSIMPGGLLIDMKGIQVGGSWRIDAAEECSNKHFELIGHIVSSLEHEIWQELTGYDAISTVRGIQWALNDGATIVNPKKNDAEDTMPDFYSQAGFTNSVPDPFSKHEWSDVFDTQPVTWTVSSGDHTFHSFKSHITDQTTSFRKSLFSYWSENGVHSFVGCSKDSETTLDNYIAQYGCNGAWFNGYTTCCGDYYSGTIYLCTARDYERQCYENMHNSWGNGVIRFFDKSDGFVPSEYEYRRNDFTSDNYTTEFVGFLRNTVYENYYSGSSDIWFEYLLPSRKPLAGYNQFKVYIEKRHSKSDDNITGMTFAIQNDSFIGSGGYVEESGGTLIPAEELEDFNNELFTDKNLILQANNHQIITPSTADPVSTVTGNMYHDETDVVIKGRGINIAFTRTYNSEQADNTNTGLPISQGWTHSFNMKLTANDYGRHPNYPQSEAPENENSIVSSITFTNERGGEVNYLVDGEGGTWAINQPRCAFDTLELNTPSSGEHTLTFRNGVKYVFEGIGGANMRTVGETARLKRIEDPCGNELTLTYDSNGRLSNISDNLGISGRTGLTFTYNANDRIEILSDWTGRTWIFGYTDENLTSVTNPKEETVQYTYKTDSHLLEDIILPQDRGGQNVTTSFDYYENNRAFNYADKLGHTETMDYDLYRKRTRVTDPRGFVREYTYDKNGALIKLEEPDKGILLFDNNADGLRYSKTDALGYDTIYSYNTNRTLNGAVSNTGGNVTLEQDEYANTVEYDYGLFDQITRVKDKNGNERSYTYYQTTNPGISAVQGKLKKAEARINGQWETLEEYIYYPDGNVQQKIEYIDKDDPSKKRVTDYTYHNNGLNLYQMTVTGQPGGESYMLTFTYDDLGRKETETLTRRTSATNSTPINLTTTYEYDSLNRVVKMTDPQGNIAETVYDANGKVFQEKVHHKIPGGGYDIRTYVIREYNAADRLIKETDIYGKETDYEYNEAGNLIKVIDANGHITRYDYDARGRRTVVIDADGHRTEIVYDPGGRVIKTINGNGKAIQFEYDALGRKTKDISPMGFETQYEYDANGNLTKVVDANAVAGLQPKNSYNATMYNEYDEFNRITKTVDALNGETVYTYDLQGNVTSITDAEGRMTGFVYDSLGRLIEVIDPIHETPTDKTVRYILYDEAGNPLIKEDREGRVTHYTYDTLNRLTHVNYLADAESETYTYDMYGDLTGVSNSAVTYIYTYDQKHRMTSKTDNRLNKSLTWQYDDVGNVIQKTDYQGEVTEYVYAGTNRLVSLRNRAYLQVSYHYDPAGRLLDRILSNRAKTNYKYDDNNRLTQLTNVSASEGLNQTQTYTYDNIGNITGLTDASGPAIFVYDPLYRLTSADYPGTTDDMSYTYDGVGNRVTKTDSTGTLHYIYNNDGNRLDEVRQGGAGGQIQYRYIYDDNGNRIEKRNGSDTVLQSYLYDQKNRITSLSTLADTHHFDYDPNDYRISKIDSGGMRIHLLEGEHLEAVYDGSEQILAKYLRGVVVDEIVNGYYYDDQGKKTNYTFHHDHLRSVVGLTAHEGSTVETTKYGSFGEEISSSGNSENFLKYTGREHDAEIGLYYYRARYYDPEVGRFLNEDPIGFEAGVNFYAYVGNNPVNYSDPDGLEPLTGALKAGAKLIQKIGGRMPRNWRIGALGKVHPTTGIPFKPTGFPDFSGVAKKTVKIAQTGVHRIDDIAANTMAGFAKTPKGYTWHHVEDGVTMQLVPEAVHIATGHTGGVAIKRAGTTLTVGGGVMFASDAEAAEPGWGETLTDLFWDIVIPGGVSEVSTDSDIPPGAFDQAAGGGFVIYPNKPNSNMINSVYSK